MHDNRRYRGRFAPSPTGALHAGSLLAALGSWLLARRANGQWLVRIEDVDTTRAIAGAAHAQLHTLAAFGLAHQEPVEYQSRRGALYQTVMDQLLTHGHAFECHCSRTELLKVGGIHRRCVAPSSRPAPAIRLRVPDGCVIDFVDAVHGHIRQHVDTAVGDFVLRRSDGLWAYQLAVVVDDAEQGITDVVRGADLLDSTPRQMLLQRLLGVATPRYTHLPLVLGSDGHKLSKSSAAAPVIAHVPLPLLHQLWQWLGQHPLDATHIQSTDAFLQAALSAFEPTRIPKAPWRLPAAPHNAHSRTHA